MVQQHSNQHPSHSKKLTEGSGSITVANTNQVKQIKTNTKFNGQAGQISAADNSGLNLPNDVSKKASFEIQRTNVGSRGRSLGSGNAGSSPQPRRNI